MKTGVDFGHLDSKEFSGSLHDFLQMKVQVRLKNQKKLYD
jgi:hypothetical protein